MYRISYRRGQRRQFKHKQSYSTYALKLPSCTNKPRIRCSLPRSEIARISWGYHREGKHIPGLIGDKGIKRPSFVRRPTVEWFLQIINQFADNEYPFVKLRLFEREISRKWVGNGGSPRVIMKKNLSTGYSETFLISADDF